MCTMIKKKQEKGAIKMKSEILKIISEAMTMIGEKQKNTSCELYAFNALTFALDYIQKERQYEDVRKYVQRRCEYVNKMRNVFGEDCLYIYALMQVYKHIYLYECDKNGDEMLKAEFYRQIANELSDKNTGGLT